MCCSRGPVSGARGSKHSGSPLPSRPLGVGMHEDPCFCSTRRQQGAQPREGRRPAQEAGVVLPFLSGAQAPQPLPLTPPALCFTWLGQHRLENFFGIFSGLFNQTRSAVTFYWQMKSRWPPPGFAQPVASNV